MYVVDNVDLELVDELVSRGYRTKDGAIYHHSTKDFVVILDQDEVWSSISGKKQSTTVIKSRGRGLNSLRSQLEKYT